MFVRRGNSIVGCLEDDGGHVGDDGETERSVAIVFNARA